MCRSELWGRGLIRVSASGLGPVAFGFKGGISMVAVVTRTIANHRYDTIVCHPLITTNSKRALVMCSFL